MGFSDEMIDLDGRIEDCKKYIKMFEDVVAQYKAELERLESDKRRREGFHIKDFELN